MTTSLTLERPGAPSVPDAAHTDFAHRAQEAGVDVAGLLHAGPVQVELDSYSVRVDGRPVELSPRQVELLALFLAAPARVWSRAQLHWVCWQDSARSRRVDVQLCRIRTRLGLEIFRNVRDRGWALALPTAH